METLIGLGVLFCIFVLPGMITNKKFDNYTPPRGQMVDHGKLLDDMTKNNLSKQQAMKNTISGKYNTEIPDHLKPYHKNS